MSTPRLSQVTVPEVLYSVEQSSGFSHICPQRSSVWKSPFLLLPFTHLRCAKVSTTSQMTSPPTVQTHPVTAEQAGRLRVTEELRQLRLHTIVTIAPDVEDDSDEEPIDVDDVPAVEEEKEQQENIPPPSSWSKVCTGIVYPTLTVPSGPHLPVHHAISEMDFFHCLLTQHTLQTIAANTTTYAHHKGAAQTWMTSVEELWLFIAVHIFMGIAHLPRSHMYWEERWLQPFVVDAFSRDRFHELLRFFHIAPPTPAGVKHTVLDKVEPLITACQHSFSSCFLPAQVLVVDESMVPFKGRDPMKQYLPDKPTSWGYKVWCVASDKYLLNFSVFRGRQKRKQDNLTLHEQVVQLVQPYQHRGHILYVDNLFVTVGLFDHLERIGMRACGTVRPDRKGLPADAKQAGMQLAKDARTGWQRGNLSCLAWNDKRLVYFLTNHMGVDKMISFDQQRGADSTVTIVKPEVVHEYNLHRGGVDTIDQLRGNYAMGRKSMKNWPSLAWWLIDMCIINAYRLFTLQTQGTASQLEFRIALMEQLARAYPPQRAPRGRARPVRRGRPPKGHYPKRVDYQRDCAYCSGGRQHRVRSYYKCDHCEKHLCVDQCFRQWHEAL